ncbi:MAG TPA: hypothetical protein VJP79_11795 [Nitrososphaera sp.]|nr:hypothetical protein [Nitrososphaera sp.]
MSLSLSPSHVKAAAFALLLFVYPVLVLSALSVHYTETIHRITMDRIFSQHVFGSVLADGLAVFGFFLLFLALSVKALWLRGVFAGIFAAAVAAAFASSSYLVFAGFASLPALFGLLAAAFFGRNQGGSRAHLLRPFREFPGKTLVMVYLAIVIIVEAGALTTWLSYPFFPTEIYGDKTWTLALLESSLFQVFDLLSPPLFILAAFAFVYRWYLPMLTKQIRKIGRSALPVLSTAWKNAKEEEKKEDKKLSNAASANIGDHPGNDDEEEDDDAARRKLEFQPNSGSAPTLTYSVARRTVGSYVHLVLLSAGLISAPLLMIYPHLPGVNLTGNGISTDERYYVGWTSTLRSLSDGSLGDTVIKAFTINNGDRPLSLLAIVFLSNLTHMPDLTIIRYLPVFLAPLLVLATYFLIRLTVKVEDMSRVRNYAALGSVFAAFSIQAVVGQYAGLLANWFGLVVSYAAFYFLIKLWDARDRRHTFYFAGIAFAVLTAIMLFHLYTWAHMLAITVLFAAASYILARKTVSGAKLKAALMIVLVCAALSVDYAKAVSFRTPLVGEAGSVIIRNVQPEGVDNATKWDQLYFILQTYVGGFLSNPALFLLALLWIVRADMTAGLNRLMFSMICMTVIPFVFGNAEFQTRVLYNIPYHIPAVLMLLGSRIQDRNMRFALIIAIVLFLATYAVRAMANLYLVLPEGYTLDRQFLLP